MTRFVRVLIFIELAVLTTSIGVTLLAQAATPTQTAGPIRLTANPPRIATPQAAANTTDVKERYVGSRACERCHAAIFERWSHTRMANVVTDPKASPNVVLGDFSKPNPIV